MKLKTFIPLESPAIYGRDGIGREGRVKAPSFLRGVAITFAIVGFFALFLSGCAHTSARNDSQDSLAMTPPLAEQHQEMKPPQGDQISPDQKQIKGETLEQKEEPLEEEEEEAPQIADPLYLWNKGWYYFNDKFYFWLMKPFAQVYSTIFPEIVRIGISNFFYNLTTPIRFVNSLLQLKMEAAGNELLRFVINTTAGVGGLGDFAKGQLNIKRHDEDLGQTFGTYGIGHGFYIVWPILGPSSLRDTIGLFGDAFLDPVNYVRPVEVAAGITAYDKANYTSLHIGDYEDLIEAAIDPYISIRDAYVQNRKKKVEE